VTDSPQVKLRKFLRYRRKEAGLTQARMARMLRITQPQLSRLEKGQQGLRFEMLLRFAKMYGLRPSELLGEAGL
jgi:UDP-N-acetylglucosamine 1-carboxyvinyltransferase